MDDQQHEVWDIVLEHLRAGYGRREVLHDVSAIFRAGAITVVLGESGCGKSTLLRHVIGLARPMGGRILYGGQDLFALSVAHFRRVRRRFGVLFQDGALLGSLTLEENVGLPLAEHTDLPRDVIHKAALRALTLVGLEPFARYYPNELSGGMRKRGGLARAIVTEPPILFCDEPTSGLDPINAAQMDHLLLGMKARYPDMTLVVVTHDLASMRRIADRIVLIRDGNIGFDGTLDELDLCDDPYIRCFMGRGSEKDAKLSTVSVVDDQVRHALDDWMKR